MLKDHLNPLTILFKVLSLSFVTALLLSACQPISPNQTQTPAASTSKNSEASEAQEFIYNVPWGKG